MHSWDVQRRSSLKPLNVSTDVSVTISSATSLTPPLVNLESMTSKSNAGGGNKDCASWKIEEAVHYVVHADKVTTDSSTDKGK